MTRTRSSSLRLAVVVAAALIGCTTGCTSQSAENKVPAGPEAQAGVPQTLEQRIAVIQKDTQIPPPLKAQMIAAMQKKGH